MSLVCARRTVVPGAATTVNAAINVTDALISSRGSNVFEGAWANPDFTANNGAAIYVTTTQPVIIQNSLLAGQQHCVRSLVTGTQITVRNCVGVVRDTMQAGQCAGRFLSLWEPGTVVCENNTMIGGGVLVSGAGINTTTALSIRYNRARNILGSFSDGVGGYVLERANIPNLYWTARQFCQITGTVLPNGGEVAWNEIENEMFFSRPEDSINLSNAIAAAGAWLRIHDNYIRGGSCTRPADVTYSGGGIVTENSTRYVAINDNQVVGYNNIGGGIAGGSDIEVKRNRWVSASKVQGRDMLSRNRAWADTSAGSTNIVYEDNGYAWVGAGGANQGIYIGTPGRSGCSETGTFVIAASPTEVTETAERAYWLAKVAAAGVRIGSTLAV